jgi:hypothetical protein
MLTDRKRKVAAVIRKMLDARATSYVLLLLIMGLFAGTIGWQVEARAETIGSVMLLIPSDLGAIEEKFKPKNLVQLGILDLGVTTEWKTISELAESGQLKALIIHHAALSNVNRGELSSWFRNDRLVLTGLGIQGDVLAELVGMRGLFIYPFWYTHPEFFYTYAYYITGTSEDLPLFEGDDGSSDFKVTGVKSPLHISSSFTTDSLLEDSDAKRMLLVTKERIEHQEPQP